MNLAPFVPFSLSLLIRLEKGRQSPVSVILGPEMAAPISWAPGISAFFLQEYLHAHKFLVLGGGGVSVFFLEGGGSADFIFMGAGIFSEKGRQ